MTYRIGIDLGGTKIEVIALNNDNQTLFRHRVATPQGDYTATLQTIQALITQTEQYNGYPASSVGIGIPGAISPATSLVKNANSTCLIGKPLQQDIQRYLDRVVQIANDADCFTLSEATDGAGADYRSVFGVILGTGVGGGIAINKALLAGPNAIAGEWGHNPLPWRNDDDGPIRACYCGKSDCIETFLSGPGFSHAFKGEPVLTAEAIWQAAEEGNPLAQLHCFEYLDYLARSLASVINLIDPEVIVLGGGLSNQAQLYNELPRRLSQYVFTDQVSTKIVPAMHGDSSGVRGAAWL